MKATSNSFIDRYTDWANKNPILGPQIQQNADRMKDRKPGEWDYSGADGTYAPNAPGPLAIVGVIAGIVSGCMSGAIPQGYTNAIAAGDPTKKDALEHPEESFPCGW